ncbi:MAG: 3-dehydroquinate synthase [Planctomycetaceae bacterium]|nr:3-dehydroquinate synthase [Planctomycetaceae bacterium]
MVPVSLGERSYEIVIGTGILAAAAELIEPRLSRRLSGRPTRTAAIVTDANVSQHAEAVALSLQSAGWNVESIAIPPGEKSKSQEVVASIYDRLVAMHADRRTAIIAVGGGVVGDSAGFVAATYNRGLPFVQVPTTLLSDVDSSVGGKVGINHPQAKNLIGAFHQPATVLIDTAALTTLTDRDYRSGLAEVVKYGVILDAAFFEFLEQSVAALNRRDPAVLQQVIATSCRLKAYVVERDEFELTGLRAVLNYGHTFGHAFEALANYGELLHGEAVAIGMVYASRLAERLGKIDASITARQVRLLDALHLPTKLPAGMAFATEEVISRMRLDKKAVAGRMRFILPTRLGHVELFDDVPESDVLAVLSI